MNFHHKILKQRLGKLPAIIELGKLLEAVKLQTPYLVAEPKLRH